MSQTWHDLLFAHWPVPRDALRPSVPAPLQLDAFEGRTWISVVPFRMSRIRPRGLPPLPHLSAFAELNVRTYVVVDDRPGVYFFSLDAASALGVWGGRRLYHLPYFRARMQCAADGAAIEYACTRTDARGPAAGFRGRYEPQGAVETAAPGTLDHWLVERYRLYAIGADGRVRHVDISHAPWPLQPARASIVENTMAAAAGITLPDAAPLLHFARRLEVHIGKPQVAS